MKALSIAGTAAMFLVGGGILTHGIPFVHHVAESWAARAATSRNRCDRRAGDAALDRRGGWNRRGRHRFRGRRARTKDDAEALAGTALGGSDQVTRARRRFSGDDDATPGAANSSSYWLPPGNKVSAPENPVPKGWHENLALVSPSV